ASQRIILGDEDFAADGEAEVLVLSLGIEEEMAAALDRHIQIDRDRGGERFEDGALEGIDRAAAEKEAGVRAVVDQRALAELEEREGVGVANRMIVDPVEDAVDEAVRLGGELENLVAEFPVDVLLQIGEGVD